MKDEKRASGIHVEQTELDVLLEEIIEREDLREEKESDAKKKVEESKSVAVDIRKKALESMGETRKRRQAMNSEEKQNGLTVKKKTRRSGSDAVEFLKEKAEQEAELREKEIELKRNQQDLENKRHESFTILMRQQQQQFQETMVQQNQLILTLISKLIDK